MLLVLLMITPAIVAEVMWCVMAWVPYRLTKTRFLIVSSVMSAVALGSLVMAVRALGHAATSAGMLS
jgi:hypothetical protein